MADPMTQSSQISSSQGFVDGQNSAASAKDSKFSDSFLSSSPVSLIQSPQDGRAGKGSGTPSEGVATSLRFSSQPGSFSPVTFGNQAPGPAGGGANRFLKDQEKKTEVCGVDPVFGRRSDPVTQGFRGGTTSNPSPFDQDSPIKTSPVSERIKALEALAAKQSDGDSWNDGGFLHFKERHYEKSPTDAPTEVSSVQKKEASPEQDSPESPFEVLGETRRGNEFEDTADWMRAHLPPAPEFGAEVPDLEESKEASDFLLSEAGQSGEVVMAVGVPDAFMDTQCGASQLNEPEKQASVEEESEFDLSFLPTAYIWEKQEKTEGEAEGPPSLPVMQEPEPPAPPAGFESTPPPPTPPATKPPAAEVKPAVWSQDTEPAEVLEVDSSGESDDTVIEDAASVPAPVPSAPSAEAASAIPEEKEAQLSKPAPPVPAKPEKQPMLVPIINVIETDEQVRSDDEVEVEVEEEDEGYQVVKDPSKEAPQHPDTKPEVSGSVAQDDSVVESIPGSSEISTTEPKPQEDNSLPSMTSSDQSPQHQYLKDDSRPESPISAAEDLSNDLSIAQGAPGSKGLDFDVDQEQVPTSEEMQTQRDLPEKSSLYRADSWDDEIIDESADLVGRYEDLSREIRPGFLNSDANDDAAQYPSPGLSLSSTEKAKPNLVQEDLLPTSSLPTEPSKPSTMQDDLDTNEHIPLTAEEPIVETSEPALKGKPMETEPSLDTKASSFDYEPQSCINSSVHQAPMPSAESTIAKAPADLGDASAMDAEESLPKPVGGQPSPRDPCSRLWNEPQVMVLEPTGLEPNEDISAVPVTTTEKTLREEMTNQRFEGASSAQDSELMSSVVAKQRETRVGENSPETMSDPESIEPECSVSAATDSFVEFMRECLKSRQEEEQEELGLHFAVRDESLKTGAPPSQPPPAMVLDVEQERLTIRALKELGDSQEEEENISHQHASNPQTPATSAPLPPSPSRSPPSETSVAKMAEEVDMWVAEAYHLAEHVLAAILTHLSVKELVHWRDPKKSGVVFGTSLLLLLSLAAFSVISVVSYLLLALLCVTISFRIYKSVIQAVQKSNEGHPFKELMEKDVSVPPETFRKHVDACLSHVNRALKHMSRLFLVEDLVDSLKLAVLMWLMTYVGAVFNGITILILADILLFTVPLVYEKNKTQIDHYVEVAHTQINTMISKLQEKLPGAVKRSKVE
ncbi:reticulon-3 isoform X1 [Megalops cyprinoides]|uniref:reticulon-3 isoform X1 n=1 Tax=Megalops cyprinoides TaxID=118141 RepID=UPI0018653B3F|nr:reticulon-3 isoform X1 [Megalops cyprinoides]